MADIKSVGRLLMVLLLLAQISTPVAAQLNDNVAPNSEGQAMTEEIEPEFRLTLDPKLGRNDTLILEVFPDVTKQNEPIVFSINERHRIKPEILDANGLQQTDSNNWKWDGSSSKPSLRIKLHVSDERFQSPAVTDSWAVISKYHLQNLVSTESGRNVRPNITFVPDGFSGNKYILIGEHDIRRHQVGQERIRIILPNGINGSTQPEVAMIHVSDISRNLPIGGRNEVVDIFRVSRAVTKGGGTAHSNTAFVVDRTGTSQNIISSYIIQERLFAVGENMTWARKGFAIYYEFQYYDRQDRLTSEEFIEKVDANRDDAIFTNGSVDPYTSVQMLAALDARIRTETNHSRTLRDVLRKMTLHEGPVSYADFRKILTDVAGQSVSSWFHQYATKQGLPKIPKDPALYTDASRPGTVDRVDDNWAHEYVHTRQDFETTPQTRWLIEGSAEYYSSLYRFKSGLIPFEVFAPQEEKRISGTLSNAENPYNKGRWVLLALDAKIRHETNGKRTLAQVFWRLNAHNGAVTHEDFKRYVAEVAGEPMDDWIDTYVTNEKTPPPPENASIFRNHNTTDSDFDGLIDTREMKIGTDPRDADTDNDDIRDGREVMVRNSDPTHAEDPYSVKTTTTHSVGEARNQESAFDSDIPVEITTDSGFTQGFAILSFVVVVLFFKFST